MAETSYTRIYLYGKRQDFWKYIIKNF